MLALVVTAGVNIVLSGQTYKVEDTSWDKLYLAKLVRAGVRMMIFKKYVDDSNQLVKTIPVGRKYDHNSVKLVIDAQGVTENMTNDKVTALVRLIANTVDG
jgi:hypothetical protein